MQNTSKITVDELWANPTRYVFCTIPRWARFAHVDDRGNVVKYSRV